MLNLKSGPKHSILPTSRCSRINKCTSNVELLCLCGGRDDKRRRIREKQRKRIIVPCCSSSSSSAGTGMKLVGEGGAEKTMRFDNLVSEFGWRVRRLVENEVEMRKVADVQAEAFHVPIAVFNDLFFDFFKAEVLAGLVYKLRNSPRDRYACLIAEPIGATSTSYNDLGMQNQKLVGVVDVTALRDKSVLSFLDGAQEYLYISGIAVLEEFRRQKVATVLLKACDLLSAMWGFEYLVLRAYDDDEAAQRLYTNAGYKIVSKDPPWTTTWIGQKRRVMMIKRSSPLIDQIL